MQRLLFAPLQKLTLEEATASRPAPTSVLDIGCGTGLLLRQVAQRFPSAQLAGIDATQEMVRVAEASLPEGAPVRFLHAVAEQLPFPDASFDLVLTTMSFHHWADQRQALSEVRRVLSSEGTFALADILAVGWLGWLLARRTEERFNSPTALEGILISAGFEVERFVCAPRLRRYVQVVIARAASDVASRPQQEVCAVDPSRRQTL